MNGSAIMPEVDCIVVGGVADGVLMKIILGAERIELSRPTHAKPLESSGQKMPEMALETDTYNVFYMQLPTADDDYRPFAWAIVDGQTPAWAAKQLAVAYVQYSTQRMIEERGKLQ